jgi:hypothetical protein
MSWMLQHIFVVVVVVVLSYNQFIGIGTNKDTKNQTNNHGVSVFSFFASSLIVFDWYSCFSVHHDFCFSLSIEWKIHKNKTPCPSTLNHDHEDSIHGVYIHVRCCSRDTIILLKNKTSGQHITLRFLLFVSENDMDIRSFFIFICCESHFYVSLWLKVFLSMLLAPYFSKPALMAIQ